MKKLLLIVLPLMLSIAGYSQSATKGALNTYDTAAFKPTIKMVAVNQIDNKQVYWNGYSWATVSTGSSGGAVTGTVALNQMVYGAGASSISSDANITRSASTIKTLKGNSYSEFSDSIFQYKNFASTSGFEGAIVTKLQSEKYGTSYTGIGAGKMGRWGSYLQRNWYNSDARPGEIYLWNTYNSNFNGTPELSGEAAFQDTYESYYNGQAEKYYQFINDSNTVSSRPYSLYMVKSTGYITNNLEVDVINAKTTAAKTGYFTAAPGVLYAASTLSSQANTYLDLYNIAGSRTLRINNASGYGIISGLLSYDFDAATKITTVSDNQLKLNASNSGSAFSSLYFQQGGTNKAYILQQYSDSALLLYSAGDVRVRGDKQIKFNIGSTTYGTFGTAGNLSLAANGALSTPGITGIGTWITGGTATTTKPYLLIEPTGATSTGWSTAGTGIGVNSATGFTGNLLDLQLNGSQKIFGRYDGYFRAVGGIESSTYFQAGASSYFQFNGRTYIQSPSDGNLSLLANGGGYSNLAIKNLTLNTAGSKITIPTGSNASAGVSGAMTAGTITISTTAVTASSLIFLTNAGPAGTIGVLSVGTITAGTSFVINSSSALDTSVVNYWIIN